MNRRMPNGTYGGVGGGASAPPTRYRSGVLVLERVYVVPSMEAKGRSPINLHQEERRDDRGLWSGPHPSIRQERAGGAPCFLLTAQRVFRIPYL